MLKEPSENHNTNGISSVNRAGSIRIDEEIVAEIISADRAGFIFLAKHRKCVIAGCTAVAYYHQRIYKYGYIIIIENVFEMFVVQ